MAYIDGFVLAVPTANKQKFIAHATDFDNVFSSTAQRAWLTAK